MTTTIVWSASELELLDEYYDGIENDDPQLLAKILWKHGMDVKNHTVRVETGILHRNRFNKIVDSKRFVGVERVDPKWRQSGYCSMEALIASSGDKDFRKELCEMASKPKFSEI